jgi:hypothetical protein
MRRDTARRVGGFEESFRGKYQLYEDQAFLAKVYLGESVYISNENWIRYRIHPNSCVSAVTRAGDYEAVRMFFLKWLEWRLSLCGSDEKVRSAVRDAVKRCADRRQDTQAWRRYS